MNTQIKFTPVKKVRGGVLSKSSIPAVKINYTDGNVEGFIKGNISSDPNIFNEGISRMTLEWIVIVALGITYFTTDITVVDGVSMEPTYNNHTIIVKSRAAKKINSMLLSRDSIIKFISPEKDQSIKRIVGLPGDKITLDRTFVKVNDKIIDNTNVDQDIRVKSDTQSFSDFAKSIRKSQEYILKDHQYFVMGDNISNSVDSRKYGPIRDVDIISIVQK